MKYYIANVGGYNPAKHEFYGASPFPSPCSLLMLLWVRSSLYSLHEVLTSVCMFERKRLRIPRPSTDCSWAPHRTQTFTTSFLLGESRRCVCLYISSLPPILLSTLTPGVSLRLTHQNSAYSPPAIVTKATLQNKMRLAVLHLAASLFMALTQGSPAPDPHALAIRDEYRAIERQMMDLEERGYGNYRKHLFLALNTVISSLTLSPADGFAPFKCTCGPGGEDPVHSCPCLPAELANGCTCGVS